MESEAPPHLAGGGGGRTREQVEAAAVAAGLSLSSGRGTELLRFAEQLNSDEVRLMEMPLEVLDAMRRGERVVIRGEPGEDAVLCTEGMSYEFRAADTSNVLLLVPSLSYPADVDLEVGEMPSKEVTACLSSYFELRTCRPKTGKLRQLLAECPYRGPEYECEGVMEAEEEEKGTEEEEEGEGMGKEYKKGSAGGVREQTKKYTFSDLLDLVQASEAELWDALEKLQACNIDGYWRLLEADYRDQAVQHILTLLEEQDWSWRSVPLSPTCHHLHELEPSFVIEHCLKCYGTKTTHTDDQSTETYYELSEERVCQFYAELLLRQAGKFNYHEFMESWQQSVPDGMTTSLQQLKGLALSDMNTMPPVIWHFPASNLPQDPAERFSHLFSVRERWTESDIEPYIRDLATPSQSLNALLLKHARVSTVKGLKVYNAKRTALTKK